MTFSAELTRFLADHATTEGWAAFANGIGTPPTAANLAAAMSAKGYQVGEAEVAGALELAKQSALADHQLDGVVGGQRTYLTGGGYYEPAPASVNDGAVSIADMFAMQMLMNHTSQVSEMSTSVVSASNSSLASNVKS
jgi:hypothetical protein